MRKRVLFLLAVLFSSVLSYAQLTGTKTIPGDYASVAAAITALNSSGVGAGGVTFNIAAGYTETFAALNSGLITATGTAANQIIFQKSGAGANPLITAATPGVGTYDYIFCIGGGDYITFNGINVQENAANTTATTQMEYGFALWKVSATDGAQYNTIKNGAFSLSNNTACYGIHSQNWAYTVPGTSLTVTAVGGANSFNKFFSNAFSGMYNGIYVYGYADGTAPYTYYDQGNEIGKDGANTFTSLGGGASTAYCIYSGYQNNFKIANNSFLGSVGTSTSAGAFYGVYMTTMNNANLDVYNNTITVAYNGTGTFYGMYSTAGGSGTNNTTNIYNNTVTGCTTPNATSGTWYGIYMYGGATSNFYNNSVTNNIHGSATATATGSIYGIYHYCSPTSAGTMNMYSNTVANNSRVQSAIGTGTGYHFYMSGGNGTMNVYNNTINNQTIGSTSTQYVAYVLYSGAKNFYNNTITNILNSNGGTLYSIYNGNGTGNALFYNNKIQNINGNAAGSIVYGFYQSSGANVYLYNNFISELKAPIATGSPAIYGIYFSGGTALGAYNNTIYLNATSTGATFGVTGIYASTTPSVELRNNIVVNTSTPMGTGRAVAYQRSSATLTTYTAASNNNDFFAGTPGANRLIFYDGTNSDQTLAAYKTRVSPRDGSSVTENPPFVNIATTPYDLHLTTTIATQCESGGATVASPVAITTDYDNHARYPNLGYPNNILSPATAPDMGADEFGGLLLDLTPPVIAFTPFMNTSSTGARVLTTTITDATGVPTSGIGLPRLYWKINSGAWNNVAGTWVSGNTFTFTFGAGVVLSDVVSYYIVAQDLVTPTPNVGSNPSAGASGFTVNPPACSTPPTAPYTYTIVGTICGTFDVGVGKTYTTLTAAIADLNNKEMTCAVTFLLNDATYPTETYPIVINANGGASAVNTLTIKPKTGITTTITGSANAGPLIKVLNNYTTIDGSNSGGTTRDLTITNTSVTTPNVLVLGSTGSGSLTGCTLKNTILINGVNSSSAVILSDGATPGTAGNFTNIVVQNNSFQRAYIALYCIANPVAGNGNGLLITGNDFSTSGTNSVRLVSVYVQGVDGATVTNNNIGNMVNTADASNLTGIWFATSTINSSILNNTINIMSGTSTGPRGIAVSSGATNSNVTVTGNTVTNLTTASSTAPYGIWVFSTTTGVTVKNNTVGTMLSSNTGGYGVRGIYVNTGLASSNVSLINNLVYDLKCTGDASLTYFNIGIGIEGSTGGVNVYHNSVYLSGTYAGYTSATVSAAFYAGTANATVDVRDNIFVNTYDNTGSTTDKSYAIYNNGSATAFTDINFNDYFVSGGPGVLGYQTADIATLAGWQAATTKDASSVNTDPTFVSTTDLHPTNTALNNLGTYIPAVPTDYAGATRYNPPDMGAYEFGTIPSAWVGTVAATGLTGTGATINGNGAGNGSTVTTSFEYGLTTAYGSTAAGTPGTISGIPTSTFAANLTGLAYNTLYHYRAKGQVGAGVPFYGADLTFTTLAVLPSVTTNAATLVTTTGATLNGSVTANNAATTVIFEYGLTTAYGSTMAATPGTVNGMTPTAVNAAVTGLTPFTLYHYRVKGTNSVGAANGADMTFTTLAPPATVTTNAASNITTTAAQLNGTVNANGFSTAVSFEWGLTTAYGNTIAGIPATVTGSTATAVLANLSGLATMTTYHYRCVGTSVGGTIYGLDQSFLTGCPPVGPAGTITGPVSVCANSAGNVYSVAAIVNATGYAWTVPAGATITAGANTTSITVTFGSTSGNVSVNGTGPCGSGTASNLAVTVNPLPVPTITGPATACQGSVGNVYTTQAGMSAYVWTVSAGGTITAGTGTNAITVTWTTSGAKTVTATYTSAGGCAAAAPGTYAVTVNAAPSPTITGPNSMCVNSGYYNYTTEAGMTGYVWTVSAGGTITWGAGTNQIQVTWNTAGAQTVTVNYNGSTGCSAATPTSLPVTVNPMPGSAGTITGTAAVCGGAVNVAYSIAPVANAVNYVWTLPAGATIANGFNTNSITVNFAGNASSGTITAQGNNLCGNGAPSPPFAVTVTALPAAAGTITGTAAVCQGAMGVVYSVGTIANATSYTWTVPSGATIVSGGTTNSITVDFGAGAVSGNVTVLGTNSCGSGTVSPSFAVTVNPKPATPTVTSAGDLLTSSAASGNQWYFSVTQAGTGAIIPGATAQTYTATQTGWYWSIVTLSGCSSDPSNREYVVMVGQQELQAGDFNIYPVPNDGKFTVSMTSPSRDSFTIKVFNNLGVMISQLANIEVNGTVEKIIDLRPAASGIYSVVIESSSARLVRKVLVNK